MERIVKGIWIPIEIWQDTGLSWNEKILLMEIDSFTSRGRECYISNEYISNLLGVTSRSASTYMNNLIERGFVRIVRFDGRQRFVESTLTFFQADWKSVSMQGGRDFPHTDNINININNNNNNINKNHFTKPSIEEIAQYCAERGNGIDAEVFFHYYESKGWMVGRSPMKNWKSAIHTWEKKKEPAPATRSSRYEKESVYEHNMRVMKNLLGQ